MTIHEFCDYIWNHHAKCIKMSTNMPGIGLVICEIGIGIEKFVISKRTLHNDANGRGGELTSMSTFLCSTIV